jgi:putative flippase GtrA
MVTAFVLNKFFVFKKKDSKRTPRQFFIFVLVNLVAVVQTLLFSLLFRNVVFPAVGFTFFPDEVAHLIGVGLPVFTSFLGHKYFSFKV